MRKVDKAIADLRGKIEKEQESLRAQVSAASQMLQAAQVGILSNEGALAALKELERRLSPPKPPAEE